jgi:hypothetical protein
LTSPVATKKRIYTAAPHRAYPLMCDCTVTWSVAGGVVNVEYPVMLMLSERNPGSINQRNVNFSRALAGDSGLQFSAKHDDSIAYFATPSRKLSAHGDKVSAFAAVLAENPERMGLMVGHQAAHQDRSKLDNKLYVLSAKGPMLCYASGDVQKFLLGWGAHLAQ